MTNTTHTVKNTFYLDMDGVVADWDLAAGLLLGREGRLRENINGTHYKTTPAEWQMLREHGRFYRDLPIMPKGQELVDLARQYRDTLGWDLLFLTAVPKDDDVPWAFSDKVMWAQERFPDIGVHFGPHSTEKWRHCTAGDILVDDREDNCAAWRSAGGLAVYVKSSDLTLAIEEVRWDLNRRISMKNMAQINDFARMVVQGVI
jgi:5'(3')-deoxyribonucleotidase